jgi:hypothetical protein
MLLKLQCLSPSSGGHVTARAKLLSVEDELLLHPVSRRESKDAACSFHQESLIPLAVNGEIGSSSRGGVECARSRGQVETARKCELPVSGGGLFQRQYLDLLGDVVKFDSAGRLLYVVEVLEPLRILRDEHRLHGTGRDLNWLGNFFMKAGLGLSWCL